MYGGPPMNPNVVIVPIIQNGCCQAEFDPTYPVHLNGIIRPDEYQESIQNINQVFRSKAPLIICLVISALLIIGGFALFIAGGVTMVNSRTFGFPILIGVAIGVFVFGMFFCFISICVVQMNASSRLQKAVAAESAKYSSRSPTPCSWRMFRQTIHTGGYHNGHHNTRVMQQLMIEIGNSGSGGYGFGPVHANQVTPYPPPYHSALYDNPQPPPYGSGPNNFCPHCGKPKTDFAARFCSSCGQPYIK